MKRKEVIEFIDGVVTTLSTTDGEITVFNVKSGESIEIDTDLAISFVAASVIAVKDLLERDESDGMSPERFVSLVIKTACKVYAQLLNQR